MSETNNGNLVRRHEQLKESLGGLLLDHGISGVLYEQALTIPTGDPVGRSDVCWVDGNLSTVHVDLSIVSPTCATAVKAGSATKDGVAAAQMEKVKLHTYINTRTNVIPAVLEAGGRVGESFGRVLRRTFGGASMVHVYHFLSCSLQCANARSIMDAAAMMAT